jgi:hypothetical protein
MLFPCGRAVLVLLVSMIWFASAPAARAADPAPVDVDLIPLGSAGVGSPQSTVGAGARGDNALPEVFIIAPPKTGATSKTQPTIYWFLTGETGQDIEMTLAEVTQDGHQGKVVKKTTLSGQQNAGVHAFNLASAGISLEPGRQYSVKVTVMLFDENVKNSFSVAFIALVPRPSNLGDHPNAKACATAGLWYDAIELLASELAKNPASAESRRQLNGLVWSQAVFSRVDTKTDAAAQERARKRADDWMKRFAAVKWDQVK